MSISRNTGYNIVGALVPIALSLLTVPIYLGLIGPARYGVLAIAWLLLGYFGLFDLGLGRAAAQRIAALRDAPPEDRAATFWSAIVVNLAMGLVGGLALWVAARYFFGHVFKVDEATRAEILVALPLLAATVPLATLSGVLIGALQGREKFLEINLISMTSTALFQCMPLLVAWLHGPQLAGLLFAALAARTLGLMALAFTCWRNLTRGQPVRVERSRMVALLKFGGWITVSAFVGPFMVILDRFVIGALLGAVAVTIYTVPFQLAQRAMFIPESLTTAVFPRLTACSGNEQISLCQAGVRSIAAVMTLFMVLGIMLIEPFLKLWIGGDFHHESAQVGRIILLGFWTNALAFVPFSFLQARGRPNIGAAVHIIELPFYFAVFYVLMQNLGTTGAAMAFSLRCAVDMVIFNHLALRSNALWAMIASISCLPIAAIGAAEFLPPLSIEWSAATALLSLAAAAVAWRIAPPQLQALVQKNLVRLRPVRTNAV